MNPLRCSFRLRLALLALAVVMPVAARPEPADPLTPKPAQLPVQGKTLRIPPPRGMVTVAVLTGMPGGFLNVPPDVGKAPEAIALFAPEPLLGRLSEGVNPLSLGAGMSFVSEWPIDGGTAGEAQRFIQAQRAMGRGGLSTGDRDSATLRAAWKPLEGDPEGDRDLPLEVSGEHSLGLEVIDLGGTGLGSIQASPAPAAASMVTSSRWYLRAIATIVVGDRALYAMMSSGLPPSTREVALLRRRFVDWVADIVLENHPEETREWAQKAARSADSATDPRPKPGESVHVERLPEPLLRVAPDYPDSARQCAISGEVVVQALVGRDGRVLDTRVVKSVPGLDRSAARAVRLWRFIPAGAGGAPVAVWVAVPVKFSLH